MERDYHEYGQQWLGDSRPLQRKFVAPSEPVMLVLLRCLHHPGLLSMLAALKQKSDDPWFPTLRFVVESGATSASDLRGAPIHSGGAGSVGNLGLARNEVTSLFELARDLLERLWVNPPICHLGSTVEKSPSTADRNHLDNGDADEMYQGDPLGLGHMMMSWVADRPALQVRLQTAPHGLFVVRGSTLIWEFIPHHSLDTPDLSSVPPLHPCARMASERKIELLQ